MFDIDSIDTENQSATAAICEQAQLFGATPERGEFDSRDVWDEDDATSALSEAFRILAEGVAPGGFQLADERESLLWGFVNCLDAQVRRLDRSVDRLGPELRDLQREQDGTEIKSRELELVTQRAQNLGDRRDAFETMRDAAAEQYRAATGETWRPRYGSHTSQTGKMTSAAIDARDFMRARKDREMRAHLPEGTLIAVAGGKDVRDPGAVIAKLDKAKAKYDDIILAHGGGPRRRAHRGALGRAQRRPSGGVQARLDQAQAGRSVPAQRGAAEPAAEGPHRLPRQRHHRQPRGPRAAARYPGPALRRIVRSASRAASSPDGAVRFFLVGRHGNTATASSSPRSPWPAAPAAGIAPASPSAVLRTPPGTAVRTSAGAPTIASGSVLRTTALGSGRTARRSSAAAAPTGEDRRRRFPEH